LRRKLGTIKNARRQTKRFPTTAWRQWVRALVATLTFGLGVASAQDWPTKPIRIIVPVPAGGAADTLARIIGERLSAKWGQPVLVDNRTGANGNIGAEAVFNAAPDGYTLLLSPPGPLAINKSLYRKLAYDQDEFVPISVIAANPNVLLVHPKVPVKTLAELLAYAKANPGKLNYASSGSGSTTHLAGELLKSMGNIDMAHIPYKGGPPAYADLLAGQVEVMFQGLATALPKIQERKVTVLAVGGDKRHPALPDVPTLNELLPGFVSVSWTGMVAPPKTPPAIVQRIAAALAETLKRADDGRTKGLDVRDLIVSTPAEAVRFTREEKERWDKVIRATNTTVD
jgi:tripartite-type tricarboxylate transporter receptor subunit TctC